MLKGLKDIFTNNMRIVGNTDMSTDKYTDMLEGLNVIIILYLYIYVVRIAGNGMLTKLKGCLQIS